MKRPMPRWWPAKNNHSSMKKLTDSKTSGYFNNVLVATIMIVLVLAGCSSTHKSAGKTLTTENLKLTYIDKAQAGREIDKLDLEHPLSISERQVIYHMVALTYENYALLGKARPVFTKDDIKKTNRLLTKALNKGHSQNIIGFKVESEEGTTQGELFASKRNLHWRFFEIRGVRYSINQNSVKQQGNAWRLVPGNGQKFHVTDQLLGSKKWTNWIEAKVNLPAPANLKTARPRQKGSNPGTAQSAPPPSQPGGSTLTTPGKTQADLEEKLKFLKYLYENQLIDEQEYQKKRKDLLDQYL
jgi:hypothetical protein